MAVNKCDLEEILKDLPSKWREALIEILLQIQDGCTESIGCEQVIECETLTSLSEFTQEGTVMCITYTDEDGVSVERCFDMAEVINNFFDSTNIAPGCVTSEAVWITLTLEQKFQALVDTICNCCPSTTTTTTTTTSSTTTTSTSTTTTTTTP